MRRWILIVLLLAIAMGCITPVKQLGCCMKENATDTSNPGCVLYDTTTFTTTDKYFGSCGGSGDNCTVSCNETASNCNVSMKGEFNLIPVCTEDQIVECVDPGCTAMVCGDFKFKPRVSPGFQSTDDAAGNVPPDEEEGAALNFYKAQCRFLPMDAKLRQVMKNSKSQINVFRMGVGGSFDEYDQYRYYFPMSDKFCNANPPVLPGEKRVDRYMNYIQWDGSIATDYDPEDIEVNCFEESDVPGSFNFQEASTTKSSTIFSSGISYNTVVPDQNNYKFAHYGRLDYWAYFVDSDGGYYVYTTPFTDQFSVHKKIDEGYYRRELAKAHADVIYDTGNTGTTRAPFECDISASECYSGNCDTRVYSRSVLFEQGGAAAGAREVVGDCNRGIDESGKSFVYCAPTTAVTTDPGDIPDRTFAAVDVIPIEIITGYNFPVSYSALTEDEDLLDGYWDSFDDLVSVRVQGSIRRGRVDVPSDTYFYWTQRINCGHDYSYNDDNKYDIVLCSSVPYGDNPPEAGGIHFIGIQGDDEVLYNGKTVIGYSLANSSTVDDMFAVKNCEMESGVDYETITISGLGDSDLDDLRTSFKPYFKNKLEAIKTPGFSDGCGEILNTMDAVISAMPWVISYRKGVLDEDFTGTDDYWPIDYYINNVPAQEIRKKNTYDEAMQSAPGTSSCELRRGSLWWFWNYVDFYYDLALARDITLFYYDKGTNKTGGCAVNDATLQPDTRDYGWCEACTESTLAYQKITTTSRVYMPGFSAKIEGSSGTDQQGICYAQYNGDWVGFFDFRVSDNVSCYNEKITDIGDFKQSIGAIGSPRTIPEASVIKERAGNYLKSGIMPVFDLTDSSNWDIDNPDAGEDTHILWWTSEYGSPDFFAEYDFERSFGNMGSSVIIVDTVSSASEAQSKAEEIFERSQIVRENCFSCLTAFHVDNPSDNETFRQIIEPIMTHPTGEFNIEMITMSYNISTHTGLTNATQVAQDLESYGRTSLTVPAPGRGKPVMIVGLNVNTNDGIWNAGNYEKLFTEIVIRQDELIRAGVVGIIYSPARSSSSEGGIVSVSGGLGTKNDKFCALQKAMQRMSESPPTALFTKTVAAQNVSCVPCSSIDLIQPGACDLQCDNGVECLQPGLISSSDWNSGDPALKDVYKCPDNTLIEPCTPCSEMGGSYECQIEYTNGTERTIDGSMSDLTSDLYLDIIGAIPKPDRCCLQGSSGANYSYYKTSFGTSVNKPIVFPKSGDPNTDCGIGDPSAIGELTSFCDVENIPLKEYDITCEVT